jgi:thiosulfate reductase cytochrome b subunit
MATQSRSLRRGLPRIPGGEPWPPPGEAPARPVTAAAVAPVTTAPAVPAPAPKSGGAVSRQLRRGLPRVPGGEPWPPPGELPPGTSERAAPSLKPAPATRAATPTSGTTPLRRGLPRVPGGEPWPPAGLAPAASAAETVAAPEPTTPAEVPAEVPALPAARTAARTAAVPAAVAPASAAPVPATVAPAPSAPVGKPVTPKPAARLHGSRTLGQWITRVLLLALGAVAAAGILVLAARGVTTLPGVPEFLKRYPGTYDLPEAAGPGFPWWAQWQHFLNIFLMLLIIRSGYQVRSQQKPPAYWTPKRGGKKISITLWLHQSLDIVWLANGVLFAVLLFASGHWMRIVPTKWEVFPNAASALLQYLTLDWPVENGWVNYNSLQQLMYFIVVFVAAPLAAITGARMSEFWPKNAKALNRVYPVEAARALHFPTMLFFVLFILIHVFLVFATGALRNLNHMFAGTDEVNWVGFWLFAAAIAITAAGWYAARPLVLAALARLFGPVSSR